MWWENLLTAQMSKHKTVLLIRIYQHLLHEMSVVFTVIYQGTYYACVRPGSSLKQCICSFRNKQKNEQPLTSVLASKNKRTLLVDSVSVCYSCKRRHLSSSISTCLHINEVESIAMSQQSFITPLSLQRRNNFNRMIDPSKTNTTTNYTAKPGNVQAYHCCCDGV